MAVEGAAGVRAGEADRDPLFTSGGILCRSFCGPVIRVVSRSYHRRSTWVALAFPVGPNSFC